MFKKGGGWLKTKKSFWLALGLLTRLPTPILSEIKATDSGRSVLFYPLVGLILGLILYLPVFFFAQASPFLLAAIITTLWAITTGGLHLDGLADSADAWLGGMGDATRIQKIMKDPLVGSAGVIAIICVLMLKVTALASIIEQGVSIAIIIAPVLGRSLILLLFLSTPYVRQNGMANDMVAHFSRKLSVIIAVFSLLFCMLFAFWSMDWGVVSGAGWGLLWGFVFMLIGFFFLRRLMLQLLGGCTGDTLGATVEVGEMLFLLGLALGLGLD